MCRKGRLKKVGLLAVGWVCLLVSSEAAAKPNFVIIFTDDQGYADLAERYTTLSHPAVMITHGFSGCGKTTVAQQVVDAVGAEDRAGDLGPRDP